MADPVEQDWLIDVCRVYRPWWVLWIMRRHEHVVLRKTCTWDEANFMVRALREAHPKFTFSMSDGTA